MALLEVRNLTKGFEDNNGSTHVVLDDLSFGVNEGEFVCILGPSGCGKTTLLSMMGGFQEPTSGTIFLDGEPVREPSATKGYVFQNYALFPWMTVEKNITYAFRFMDLSQKEKDERLNDLLEMAHLKGHENKYPIQLSGGMQQRVAVARALACRPKVLLLDEPLGAVDFQMRELMQNQLDEIIRAAKITAVMVTHDVAESVFMSDRVIVMSGRGGEILEDVRIDLDRPRSRDSAEFEQYVEHITQLLRHAFSQTKHLLD